MRFIFVFLDGVGLGDVASDNPLSQSESHPFLASLLDGPLVGDRWVVKERMLLKPIDAGLGVPGLPQSATGQTALYTGCNAPKFRGRHQTGFANGSLRSLIESHGLLKRVLALGGAATLANFYSPHYFDAIAQRRLRYSVGTLLNLTAGLPFRMQADYAQEQAIYWDITGDLAHYRGVFAPPISPAEAGRRLAVIGSQHHLTLFECYLTDFAGHAQDWEQAVKVLQRVDGFLESIITHLGSDATLVVSSDHGNIETLSTKTHTLNPVPLFVFGPEADAFQAVDAITGITPLIVQRLQTNVDRGHRDLVASSC